MEIEVIKKLIKKNRSAHRRFVADCEVAERYYHNKNDVLYKRQSKTENNPLRNADNRVPRNFHQLLVNQKAAYMMTAPPLFDVGDKSTNERITEILGDSFPKIAKDTCVNASNYTIAWIHYWINEGNEFKYAIVDTRQVIPVYSSDLEKKIIAVMRTYKELNEESGKEYAVWEYWTDAECYSYIQERGSTWNNDIVPFMKYDSLEENSDGEQKVNVYTHDWGEVPFIPFYNNNIGTDDLTNIKCLIDAYDKVFSGFLNDLEDIQEVIFIIENYGGQDLTEFLQKLKGYKAINVETDDEGNKGDVRTLNIEIPIEARKEFLEITRRAIFEQGQGVDPNPEKFSNTSGEALKFLYSLLELKAGFAETEFRVGFSKLVRAICKHLRTECKQIIQTWTRTAVTNDKELAEISNSSVGNISKRSTLRYHPFVEDVEAELKQIEKEQSEEGKKNDDYKDAFPHQEEGEKGVDVNGEKKQ